MTKEEFKKKYFENVPNKPGVYKYYDERKRILYVGKAKNLRKRVNSYFTGKSTDQKTAELVKRIHSIDYHIVPSESEALLLENNLIKSLRPPFNINLKDNKNYYPSIVILDERFPRTFLTRNAQNFNVAEKYGPFTYASSAWSVMDYIQEHYLLRTCKLELSDENISQQKFRPCLQYHIKKCKAPCIGLQSLEEYNQDIEEIRKILTGNLGEVQKSLKYNLQSAIEKLEFEKAEELKTRLQALDKYQSTSIIDTTKIGTADVIDFVEDEGKFYFTYFHIKKGKLIEAHQNEITPKIEDTFQNTLLHVLLMYRKEVGSEASEVIISQPIDFELEGIKWTLPKRGIKKHLLDMAKDNSTLYHERKNTDYVATHTQNDDDILKEMQEKLQLANYPRRIECFDNSNIQGTSPVAALVSFLDGKPDKKNYRKFNIKTVQGPDDFASMYEVVYRRYKRQLDEYKPLPDLIIIDGGKGQLNAATRALQELGILEELDVIGLAKKKEEIFIPNKKEPIWIDFNSAPLLLIRRIRDEVHRFGITFHRQKRSQNAYKSKLDDIKGIGPKSKEKLLRKFKTLDKMAEASLQDLEKIVNKTVAKVIFETLNKK